MAPPQKIGDMTVDDLKNALGGSSNSAAKPAGLNIDTKQLVDGLGSVYNATVPVILGFQRVATGAEPAAIALNNLSNIASGIGLSKFGSAIEIVGKAVLENKTQLDQATRAGFATNDIFKFTREAAQAGLTTEEWNRTLKDSGANIAGLAGSNARSAEVFSSFAKDVRESDVGGILQSYGVTQKELADFTALSLTGNRKLNLADAESRTKAREAAEQMALQITETAAATGMSRDALAQQTKSAQESADTFMVLNTLEGKQKDAYLETQVAIKALGPAADHLQVAFQTGKFDETAKGFYNALNAVNGSGDKLQAAQQGLARAMESGDAAQIEAARQAQTRAVADAQAAMMSKQYNETALISNSNLAKVSRETAGNLDVQKSLRTAQANAQETGLTGDQAYEAGAAKARLEFKTVSTGGKVDANGRPVDEKGAVVTSPSEAARDPGQALTRGINEFNDRIKTQASAVATNFENINKQALNTPGAVEKFNNAIAAAGGPRTTTEATVATQQEQFKKAQDYIGNLLNSSNVNSGSGTASEKPSGVGSTGNVSPIKKKAGGGDVDPGEPYLVGENGPEIIKPRGSMTVVPNDQIGSGGKGINFSEISKTIDTTISSAGGGSTTTSRVQNDDSKKAEVEIEKVRTQYAADRQQLLEQTRAQLGSDATFKDISKAMRTGDAAIALEEKYKAIMDPLQKRIDEGTSIEVSRKEGVIEKTRQQVEEHTKILSNEVDKKKSAASQSASIQTDAEKAKMAGYEREANLAKEVIGKNVAGLSDDAITAMLPKGAKMDDFYIDMNNKLQSFSADYVTKIQDNEKKKQEAVTTASVEQVDIVKTTEQLKKAVSSEQVAGKVEEAKAQMSKVLQTIDVKQLTGQLPVGAVTEQKKQMEDMFGKIGGGNLLGDMFNPKIIDAKQAEINKAKFAEEDKAKNEKQAEAKRAEDAKQQASKQQSAVPAPTDSHPATLNDLNEQLKTLNSMMLRVISNTADMANHAEKTAKNTKQGR